MSYCVEYNPELKKQYPIAETKQRMLPVRQMMCGLGIVLLVYAIFAGDLLRHLIPGDPDVTSDAFLELVQEIEEGEPVREAVLTFCRDIIANEK